MLQWLNQFNEEDRTFGVDTLTQWIDTDTSVSHARPESNSLIQRAREKLKSELSLFEVDEKELVLNETIAAGGAGQVSIGTYCTHKVAVKQIYSILMEGARDEQGLTEISKEAPRVSHTLVLCLFSNNFLLLIGGNDVEKAAPSVHHRILRHLQGQLVFRFSSSICIHLHSERRI